MNRRRAALACAALVAACVAAGCGTQARPGAEARLSVTADFGNTAIDGPLRTPVSAGLTAIRQLQAHAKVETTYGGRYVSAIGTRRGSASAGRDWLYYVNGVESDVGAAAARLGAGDVVQWDFHDWLRVKTGKAIVGAFPEPLRERGARLICRPASSGACDEAKARLRAAGVKPVNALNAVTVVVGAWDAIARVTGVPDLTAPAAENGMFVRVAGDEGARRLDPVLSNGGVPRAVADGSIGFVAASREGRGITWVVSGVDAAGAKSAAAALDAGVLRNRFAVLADATEVVPLPLDAAQVPAR